jgi:2-hydroxy-6-oxonona-2,4-dienedioate hydrolase
VQLEQIYLKNGEYMAYRRAGRSNKPKLVLLHGEWSCSGIFVDLMQQLEADYELLAIDLRGCGQSSYQRSFDSFAELAVDVQEVLVMLEFTQAHVLGSSVGGAVAMELVALMPSIQGCILTGSIGPSGYASLQQSTCLADLASLQAFSSRRQRLKEEFFNLQQSPHYQQQSLRFESYSQPPRSASDYDLAILHFNISHVDNGFSAGSGRMDQVQCPFLVLHGQQDTIVNPAVWQELALPAQVQLLENCGHLPLLEAHDAVVQAICGFLG